jgi:hypothetical protein
MIERPTVLVLGAGASMPFGFPSGQELMREILEEINPDSAKMLFRALLRFDFNANEIDRFYNSLSRSQKCSVDEFLEHRPEFMRMGKIAITLKLSTYEDEKKLFDHNTTDKNWYRYLWNKLSDVHFEQFDKNKLSIITFNYDRSIEHYLITAMMALYEKPENECAEKLKGIPIIHVHGRLGALPWQEESGRSYYKGINYDDVESVSKQIKVITEQENDTSPEFDEAFKILSSSKFICFLGFGYNSTNLRRLRIQSLLPKKIVFGTSFGFGLSERKDISYKWQIILQGDHNEILEFLKNHFVLE